MRDADGTLLRSFGLVEIVLGILWLLLPDDIATTNYSVVYGAFILAAYYL
jgi:hypothetical protein